MTNDVSFEDARERLEQIIEEVKSREKDLDESIELLEEGVKLANLCTEKLAEEATDEVKTDAVEQNEPEEEVASEADALGEA